MTNSIPLNICSLFGICKKTKMPGTIASFIALIFSFSSYYFFNKTIYIVLFLFVLFLSFWAIKKVQEKDGVSDHQWIGIDEWIGMWIANMFLFEFTFNLTQAIVFSMFAFIIFRIIDIFKFIPPLQNINNEKNQSAFNVIFDDFIGGIYTYFFLLLILGSYNLNYLYASFILLLPAMIANMTPVLLKINLWSNPINEEIFGKNKTWRGFIGAIIIGTFSYFLLVKFNLIESVDNLIFILLIGFLFSFGAIGGDLIKSYFKRKIGIKAGESFTPWDQIDYILGVILLTYFIYQYSFSQIIFLLMLGGITSALTHRLGFLIKMTKNKQ